MTRDAVSFARVAAAIRQQVEQLARLPPTWRRLKVDVARFLDFLDAASRG